MYFSQATVPLDSVFDRAIKLRDCTLVGFRQKAFQTGEHTFKMIANGVENHATSTCGKSRLPCRSRCIRPLPDNPGMEATFEVMNLLLTEEEMPVMEKGSKRTTPTTWSEK